MKKYDIIRRAPVTGNPICMYCNRQSGLVDVPVNGIMVKVCAKDKNRLYTELQKVDLTI